MAVNRDKVDLWKNDIINSIDMYNAWFLKFAPEAYRTTRIKTTKDVEDTLAATANLTDVNAVILKQRPKVLPTLRMSACPPLAVDRLVGLAGVSKNLVKVMEEGRIPIRMTVSDLDSQLAKVGDIIEKMADPDIFVWLQRAEPPTETERHRAATIIADRLCGSVANPIIRNAQEKRQLFAIRAWLKERGYRLLSPSERIDFRQMEPGTFSFRLNVPVRMGGTNQTINIPIDAVVMPLTGAWGELPLLIEAKSAGDFTNVNKRRKEEAVKMAQLRRSYGEDVRFILFLCGYFDSGYLGYEAAEGIDWVWEHRIDDLEQFGL
jgi:type II restriction enzyme